MLRAPKQSTACILRAPSQPPSCSSTPPLVQLQHAHTTCRRLSQPHCLPWATPLPPLGNPTASPRQPDCLPSAAPLPPLGSPTASPGQPHCLPWAARSPPRSPRSTHFQEELAESLAALAYRAPLSTGRGTRLGHFTSSRLPGPARLARRALVPRVRKVSPWAGPGRYATSLPTLPSQWTVRLGSPSSFLFGGPKDTRYVAQRRRGSTSPLCNITRVFVPPAASLVAGVCKRCARSTGHAPCLLSPVSSLRRVCGHPARVHSSHPCSPLRPSGAAYSPPPARNLILHQKLRAGSDRKALAWGHTSFACFLLDTATSPGYSWVVRSKTNTRSIRYGVPHHPAGLVARVPAGPGLAHGDL